jgi:hypothetical protein
MPRMTPLSPKGIVFLALLVSAILPVMPAAADDPYPQGALAFFDLQACPTGWALATGANSQPLNGYFVVPFAQPVPAGTLGTTVNAPLSPGEDRTHTHQFSSQVTLTDLNYVAAAGCGCCGLCSKMTNSGGQSFTGTTNPASDGLPYIAYLFCEKTTFQRNTNPPVGIPQYLAAFFLDANCPVGWKPALTTGGRLIVVLPAAGTPGLSFGGALLKPGEDRTHTHSFSGQVSLSSQNVIGGTGCCDDGWGRPGTYNFNGTTDAASTGQPYVIVSQCQTCLPGDADPACLGRR